MNYKNNITMAAGIMFILGFLFLSSLILSTGCWDKREPDLLAIVDAVAFDFIEDKNLFRVIVEVANPLAGGDEGNGGGGGTQSKWVVEGNGHTISQAVRDMEILTTRQLHFSHVRVVLFSEEMARRGITPVLDFIDRDRESRMVTIPFVVRGDVRKLIEAGFPMEDLGGGAMAKQYSVIRMERNVVPEIDSVRMLVLTLSIPGRELVLPLAEFIEEASEDEENEKTQVGAQNPVKIAGAAVFRGEKLIGFLDDRETAGYMWITGNVRQGTIVIKCPGNEEDLLTVEVFETRSRLEPVFRENEVRFKLFIRAEGRIQDFYCDEFPLREEFISSLNSRLGTVIRNEITVSLEKARELEVDIFGLGNVIYRTKNNEWKGLDDRWEKIFPTVMVDMEIETFIRRHGLILGPIKIR